MPSVRLETPKPIMERAGAHPPTDGAPKKREACFRSPLRPGEGRVEPGGLRQEPEQLVDVHRVVMPGSLAPPVSPPPQPVPFVPAPHEPRPPLAGRGEVRVAPVARHHDELVGKPPHPVAHAAGGDLGEGVPHGRVEQAPEHARAPEALDLRRVRVQDPERLAEDPPAPSRLPSLAGEAPRPLDRESEVPVVRQGLQQPAGAVRRASGLSPRPLRFSSRPQNSATALRRRSGIRAA